MIEEKPKPKPKKENLKLKAFRLSAMDIATIKEAKKIFDNETPYHMDDSKTLRIILRNFQAMIRWKEEGRRKIAELRRSYSLDETGY